MNTPPRPLNIMADPRVFRGSVVARQRMKVKRLQLEMERKAREDRWKANAVQNQWRLEASLFDGPEVQIVVPTASELAPDLQQRFKQFRMARLNGPLRKRAAAHSEAVPPLSIDAKQSPQPSLGHRLESRRSVQEGGAPSPQGPAPLSHFLPRLGDSPAMANGHNFKNVRFLPHTHLTGATPCLGGRGRAQAAQRHAIRRQLGGPRRGLPQLARGVQRREYGEEPAEAPPAATADLLVNNVALQTDDDLAFDADVQPLVEQVSRTAIEEALRQLLLEEEQERCRAQLATLRQSVALAQRRNEQLATELAAQRDAQSRLVREKCSAERRLDALELRRLARQEVELLVARCLRHLTDRRLIRDDRFTRDRACDTSQLQAHAARHQRTVAEVRRDFFPYVYRKAERAFVDQLTVSHLRDALFARDHRFRRDAHRRLNEEIARYDAEACTYVPAEASTGPAFAEPSKTLRMTRHWYSDDVSV